VAICGQAADGHDFIGDALSRGACAVVAERRTSDNGPIFCVPDSRLALAQLAAVFHGDPSAHMTLIGVTGTNGKTTVTYLVESMLTAAGLSAGVIGTNNCRYAGRISDTPVTTPESLDLQRMLADMRAEGVSHVVMEVSSHGIDLKRVASCRFDVGAFTNLTQDHLDYHGSMEDYWNCKRRFFTEHLSRRPKAAGSTAVINMDNPHGRELFSALGSFKGGAGIVTYGRDRGNDIFAPDVSIDLSGLRGTITTAGGSVSLRSPLVGAHNLENILCAVAIAAALKLPLFAVQQGIDTLACVPGRLERVDDSGGRTVFVDYAHTPDALENVLRTLRDLSRRRLICVFGCGGDRDRGKRPLMGKIAGEFCDLAVVTSDNPRTEAPDRIIAGILPGVREEMVHEIQPFDLAGWNGTKGFVVMADRAEAIREAIRGAEDGDVVLIAGKGHETYQIIGREKRDFDDRRVAAEAIEDNLGEGVKGQG
jgi:UDP-N-acetylmuramyl-tripeptide synthetase